MANRRMLHKSISINKQVNSLTEFDQLLFTWTIPHLDDFGKIDGDALVIKALVMPMSKRPVEDFEKALQKMAEIKLIERYAIGDKLIIKYPTFDRYQTGLNKRTASMFPNPPGSSEDCQDILGNSGATEENRIKGNRTNTETEENEVLTSTSVKYDKDDDEEGYVPF